MDHETVEDDEEEEEEEDAERLEGDDEDQEVDEADEEIRRRAESTPIMSEVGQKEEIVGIFNEYEC